ncbi:MAG TPA: protein kinase [Vicinamibacterales bacterium]|nr:protein kinase [Vicinamibacterales bacterium]
MTLSPGVTLGPYRVEALAGAGAMGEVYRASDTRLNRTVALKILPAQVAAVPGLLERFEREARAIAAVEHLNICPLYDVGTDQGVNFLVMQFVDGETLADRIARGPIPVRDAIVLARQIAAGLDAAHVHGIIHRDLKPSNIRLTADLQVKLVDFGLAKAMSPGSGHSLTLSASPSDGGQIVGTAAYMSPEQARGQSVDKRTDIWAFGGVLFEMLTGRRPFPGDSLADVFAAIVTREPDWNALPGATPRRVRDLVRRCLEKDPARRLRDIGDALLELEDAASEAVPGAGPAGARPARSIAVVIPWVVAAVAIAVAAAALVFPRRAPERETPPSMRFSMVTNFAGVEAQPSLSPDGRSLAFVSNRDGQWDLYVGLVTGGGLVRLTNDPNVESRPRWSPDGTRLLYSRLNDAGLQDIWVTPAFPGTPRRVVAKAFSPTWTADGRRIAYSSANVIWTCDADGANVRQVTKPEPAPIFHDQPAFDRSGRSVAFIRRRLGPRSEVAVIDLDTGTVRDLTNDDALVLSPAWSPDGRFIYFSSSRGGTLNIWRLTLATSELAQITAGQGDDVEVDVSTDGTRIVFASYRANTNLAEVSLDPASLGRRTWLTKDLSRSETAPRYSPDGRRIAYFTNRSGAEREGIWLMDADGGNATQVVEDDRRTNVYPRWTPDGQDLIIYSRSGWDEDARLRRIPLAGGAPQVLAMKPWFPYWGWGDIGRDGRILYRTSSTTGEIFDPATQRREPVPDLLGDPLWADDGKLFAFATRAEGPGASDKPGLWVSSLAGTARQVFGGWVIWFAWDRRDSLLFIEGRPDLKGTLWRISADAQRTVVLKDIGFFKRPADGTWIARFDVHPDGRRMVLEGLENYESDIGMIEILK